MTRFLALLRDWLAWSVPADVDPSMPQTFEQFRAQRGKDYPYNRTGSPINRRAS